MKFTNISGRAIYMQCCHREVAHLGTFSVPWLQGRKDRGLRMAMTTGALAWASEKDEPVVPGSPKVPKRKPAPKQPDARAELKREQANNEALKRNMSRMGQFAVPQLKPRSVKAKTVSTEKPVTAADVIRTGTPKSLADIQRHNKAIRQGK